MEKYYALIGNCKMDPSQERGITVCTYNDQTAALEPVGTFCMELNIGCQLYDRKSKVLYASDEYWSLPEKTGGGGHVVSMKLDPASGKIKLTSQKRTYGPNPSYICLDSNGKYMLAVHHTTEHFVTHTVMQSDGTLGSETLYDDCTILLYDLNPDGTVGAICDLVKIEGIDLPGGHRWPHLHAVIPDPSGRYFIINDKGLRKIYVYSIDAEKRKLIKVSEADAPEGSESRYGVFSQDGKYYYLNFEDKTFISSYAFDSESGKLQFLESLNAASMPADGSNPMCGDIILHPNGKWIYCTFRTDDLVSAIAVNSGGGLKLLQTVSCGGNHPRGLSCSPDGRFLFVMNSGSRSVDAFEVTDTGSLLPHGRVYQGGFPGNMQIIPMN